MGTETNQSGSNSMEVKDRLSLLGEIHSQVITWTGNCDSKASIVMALEVVLSTFLFTSDHLIKTIANIVANFVHFCKTGEGSFSCLALLVFLSFSVFCVMIGFSLTYLYKSLKARLDAKEDSLIYFGKILNLQRQEYQDKIISITESDVELDRINQIYNCSDICNQKFSYYNKALWWVFWSFVPLACLIGFGIVYFSLNVVQA